MGVGFYLAEGFCPHELQLGELLLIWGNGDSDNDLNLPTILLSCTKHGSESWIPEKAAPKMSLCSLIPEPR